MSQTVEIIVEPNIINVEVTTDAITAIGLATHIANLSNPHQVTKSQVGLGSVDNTADAAKNVLTATKLLTERNINGVAFDGTTDIAVTSPSNLALGTRTDTTQPITNDNGSGFTLPVATTTLAGLLSGALKTAYDAVVTWISTNGANVLSHLASTSNPHSVTKTQVGLSNVDNTSDANKPLSILAVASYNAASGVDTPLTNAMSPVQMFQNLQKQSDNRYTKTESQQLVDGIKVGGRNLLSNTANFVTANNWNDAVVAWAHNDGSACLRSTNINSGTRYTGNLMLKPNTVYTFSCQYYRVGDEEPSVQYPMWVEFPAHGGTIYGTSYWIKSDQQTIRDNFVTCSITFRTPVNDWINPHLYIYDFTATAQPYFTYVKLEEGNKATDWSPAPEDVQTAIDAKVADNLTASTTVAPSKTAVNTALDLKADISAATGTSVALTFTSDSVQGTVASPLTGNITGNITGAKLGVVTLVIHNHTTAPTFDSKYKKLSGSGSYVTGAINYIFCEYINDTEIIYSINQRT